MFNLKDALHSYVSNKPKWSGSNNFHISDMGKCHRMRCLKRLGAYSEPFDARKLLIFEIGNINHSFLQKVAGHGRKAIHEYRVYWPLYELSGRCDTILPTEKLLYEYKNTHSRKLLYGDIDEQYILQGLTYVHLLRNQFDIDKACIALISRDDWIIKEERYSLTNEWMDKIYKDLQTLLGYWRKGILPPELADDDKRNWQCGYCNYQEACPNAVKRAAQKKEKKRGRSAS